MATCVHHPEATTRRRCQLCQQPFCSGCLEPSPGAGAVCASCDAVLRAEQFGQLNPSDRDRVLARLKQEVRASLPPLPRSPFVELLYWSGVLLPFVVVGVLIIQTLQVQKIMAFLSEEPRLPAVTTARLMAVATRLEESRTKSGHYPKSLQELINGEQDDRGLRDPYAPQDLLRYAPDEHEFRLCSIGPDRKFSEGRPLDRMTAQGDLCVGGRRE